MNLLLPEANVAAGVGVSEQSFETLWPGKRASFYIPIPNSIIRSPGNNRKMFRAFKRVALRNLIMRFMFMGGVPGGWIFVSSWISCGSVVSLNFGR